MLWITIHSTLVHIGLSSFPARCLLTAKQCTQRITIIWILVVSCIHSFAMFTCVSCSSTYHGHPHVLVTLVHCSLAHHVHSCVIFTHVSCSLMCHNNSCITFTHTSYSFKCHIHSCVIHSGYLYSAPSSPLLLRGAPDTAPILCRNFTPKRHCCSLMCHNNLCVIFTHLLHILMCHIHLCVIFAHASYLPIHYIHSGVIFTHASYSFMCHGHSCAMFNCILYSSMPFHTYPKDHLSHVSRWNRFTNQINLI